MKHTNNQKPPKTWLTESILVTLLCCLPLGIAGIIYASKVETAYNLGDIERANRASRQAKECITHGFALGIITIFVIALIQITWGYRVIY